MQGFPLISLVLTWHTLYIKIFVTPFRHSYSLNILGSLKTSKGPRLLSNCEKLYLSYSVSFKTAMNAFDYAISFTSYDSFEEKMLTLFINIFSFWGKKINFKFFNMLTKLISPLRKRIIHIVYNIESLFIFAWN